MTSAKHLAETGNMHHLKLHFSNPETTIVKSELYLALGRRGSGAEFRVPDLLIAFGADPELYERNNGYVVSEQGKPPDFVLEIASPSTGQRTTPTSGNSTPATGSSSTGASTRRTGPAKSGWPATGWWGGAYEPVAIEELDDGVLQGYSAVLNLHLRWEQGQLAWHDPATGRHIATFESERAARVAERNG